MNQTAESKLKERFSFKGKCTTIPVSTLSPEHGSESTVAELLVKCLENEGVKYVFGIPGEENVHFVNALKVASKPLNFILEL